MVSAATATSGAVAARVAVASASSHVLKRVNQSTAIRASSESFSSSALGYHSTATSKGEGSGISLSSSPRNCQIRMFNCGPVGSPSHSSLRLVTSIHQPPNGGMGPSSFQCRDGLQKRHLSSASKRDFYDVLGVPKGSDKGTVKKAYFKLAKQYHPDQNQGDAKAAEKFKEATEAYEVLSDDKQRELYDTYGHAGVDPNSGFGAGGPGGNPFGGMGGAGFEGFNFGDGSFHFSSSGPGASEIDAEELFDAFFGGGRRRPRGPRRGSDLQMHVRLNFQEAVFGTSKDLHLRYQIVDSKTGRATIKERDVTVETPPGIDNGMNMRLQGQGAEGDPGAPRGNLLVQVIVDEDDYFHRDGMDVHTEVPISLTQAVLGGTVDVRTLTGVVEMKVPKGCQVDTKLLLRGKGITRLHGTTKGNQVVHLKIEIPKEITPRQEELLREYDEETKNCGSGGISGRLAKAAGSAFESFFGGKKEEESGGQERGISSSASGKEGPAKDKYSDKDEDSDDDDEVEEKKRA